MTQFVSVDFLLQELQVLQQSLETLNSLEATLETYERMFALVHEGFCMVLHRCQQSHLLSLHPQGDLLKDNSGNPVTTTFSINPNN